MITPADRQDAMCGVQAAGAIELFFYGELSEPERLEVERHLAGCAACRELLAELRDIRDALARRPVVAAPPSGDWTEFMARLDSAIGSDPGRSVIAFEPTRRPGHQYVAYLAMAALLTLVTISVLVTARARVGSSTPDRSPQTADLTPLPAPADDEAARSLTALTEQHFERSKLVVLGLAAKDARHASTTDWEYERKLASSLLSDTRLYRMAAEEQGLTAVAGVMRDLELVLLQTSLSDQADAGTLAQIQRLIRKRDLLEKMNVVTTRGL